MPQLQAEGKHFLQMPLPLLRAETERTDYLKYPVAERLMLSSKAACACERGGHDTIRVFQSESLETSILTAVCYIKLSGVIARKNQH